jgi:hypothetical protein
VQNPAVIPVVATLTDKVAGVTLWLCVAFSQLVVGQLLPVMVLVVTVKPSTPLLVSCTSCKGGADSVVCQLNSSACGPA